MRVIAGKARRLQLKAPPGLDTRPTTDRIKETLFNMLQQDIYDVNFLDLFAGSGAIGIEALSRGAKRAVFVESDRRTADIIRANLMTTHLTEQAEILNMTAASAVRQLSKVQSVSYNENEHTFDMVFMDPPYNRGLEKEILINPDFLKLLSAGAIIIVEASLDTVLDDCDIKGLRIIKEKIYKTNKHIFLEHQENEIS